MTEMERNYVLSNCRKSNMNIFYVNRMNVFICMFSVNHIKFLYVLLLSNFVYNLICVPVVTFL